MKKAKTKESKKVVKTVKAAKKPSKAVKQVKSVTVKVTKPVAKVEIKTAGKAVKKPVAKKAIKKVEAKSDKTKGKKIADSNGRMKAEIAAAAVLWEYNQWRRGMGEYQFHKDPKKNKEFPYDGKMLGLAIDVAIDVLTGVKEKR